MRLVPRASRNRRGDRIDSTDQHKDRDLASDDVVMPCRLKKLSAMAKFFQKNKYIIT
jgi:hypothetical protein